MIGATALLSVRTLEMESSGERIWLLPHTNFLHGIPLITTSCASSFTSTMLHLLTAPTVPFTAGALDTETLFMELAGGTLFWSMFLGSSSD